MSTTPYVCAPHVYRTLEIQTSILHFAEDVYRLYCLSLSLLITALLSLKPVHENPRLSIGNSKNVFKRLKLF